MLFRSCDVAVDILVDAQTSGGLLVALPPESVDGYVAEVRGAVPIGEFTSGSEIIVSA